MRILSVSIMVFLTFAPAFAGNWLQPDGPRRFADSNNAQTTPEQESLDRALTLDPITISDFNAETGMLDEPLKVQHDVAVMAFDEPSRLYALDGPRVKAYVGEFSGGRMFKYEGEDSAWQYGPAIGAGYKLNSRVSVFTEYQRGWWGLDEYSDWLYDRGDSVYMGIKFEFGATKKSD